MAEERVLAAMPDIMGSNPIYSFYYNLEEFEDSKTRLLEANLANL